MMYGQQKDINGKWYLFNRKSGKMEYGQQKDINGKWYLLDRKAGDMLSGFQKDAGHMYYFGKNDHTMYHGVKHFTNYFYFDTKSGIQQNDLNTYLYLFDHGYFGKANSTIERAIAKGLSIYGAKWEWGADSYPTFDCSAFIQWIFASVGVSIGRTTFAIATDGRSIYSGTGLVPADMKRGDVMIMNLKYPSWSPSYGGWDNHAMIYLGDGFFLHDSPYSHTGGVGISQFGDWHDSIDFKETWGSMIKSANMEIRAIG
jgi:cell wall-associated NlpC family hydrolase